MAINVLPTIDFRSLYRRAGLVKGSRSWTDYERGKRILRRHELEPDQYEEGIKALTEYLKV